jgi:ABC-type multidrug transport system ATPase subunit
LQLALPDPPRSSVAARRRTVVGAPAVDYAIEAYSLKKVYRTRNGKQAAVDGLDLRVPVGGVHGFLGPNGSGKTTTIRMLLGLIDADAGHIRIFDHEVPLALDQIIDRVGAIVEQPKFFPAFSGEKNLRLLARAIGAPQKRVAAVLDEVGLARRGSDKFRKYSLGMKQRLAIAATLLKNPDLLIFDEPTNGLDPAGIHEIRSMMRNLARRGKTVLVSSHILSEVQQIADTVTIIGRGRLLAEGDVSQILSADGQLSARVGVSDHSRAAEVLTRSGFTVEPLAGRLLKVSLSNQRLDLAVITRLLADQNLYVSELTPIQPDLESVFLNLTAGEHLGAQQQRRHKSQQRPLEPQRTAAQRKPQGQRRRQPERPDWGGRE